MYFQLTLDDVPHFNCDDKPLADRDRIDIATIACNNELVISHQIRLLGKHLLDPHYYTIADNSTERDKQELIRQLCEKNGIGYIKLPPVTCKTVNSNLSHGWALNWVYMHYINKRQAKYFGFIDHDIYPFRPAKILEQLQEVKLYGLTQSRNVPGIGFRWYLWPGLCFFDYDYVKDRKLNFMPGDGCDVGGKNWKPLYSDFDRTKIPPLRQAYVRLRDGDDPETDNHVEYIGDWLHTCNGSNWRKTPDKNDLVDELLNRY